MAEKGKKAGFIKRRGRFIAKTVNPEVVLPDGSSASSWSMIGGMTGGVFTTIKKAFGLIRRGLSNPPDPAAFTPGYEHAEYNRLYHQSGLSRAKVQSIRTGLRVELGVFIAFGLYAVVQIAYGVLHLGSGLMFPVLVGLGVIFTGFAATRVAIALWRLDMHANERYQPIGVWLRRGGKD